MEVIDPKVEITSPMSPEIGQAMIEHIERIARTCYKSNHLIKEGSAYKFTKHACAIGHTSVIEHASISVKFTCSRAASHQIVRHRMASYAQESQRYCNYSKDQFGKSVVFIRPEFIRNESSSAAADERKNIWTSMMEKDEEAYFKLLEAGVKPQEARMVLPNSCKTELNMTANLREWRTFFALRCDSHADDEIRYLATDLLKQFHQNIPAIFDDLYEYFVEGNKEIRIKEMTD